MADYFVGCWNVARENSSSDSMPSWLASSWSKSRLASLSAAPLEPAIAFVVVDGLAPRGAIVVSLVDDFWSAPVVVDVVPEAGMPLLAPVDGVVVVADDGVVDVAPVDGVAEVAPVDGDVVDGVSAALANDAAAMPIVDTIKPETSLLLSRRIIARSFNERQSPGCRNAVADARILPASSL